MILEYYGGYLQADEPATVNPLTAWRGMILELNYSASSRVQYCTSAL